jgi:hypothetical protein
MLQNFPCAKLRDGKTIRRPRCTLVSHTEYRQSCVPSKEVRTRISRQPHHTTSFCSAKPTRWLPATSPRFSTPPSRTSRCSSLLSATLALRTSRYTWSRTCGRPGPTVSMSSTLARPGRRLSLPRVSSSPLTTQLTVRESQQFEMSDLEVAKMRPKYVTYAQQSVSSPPVPMDSVPFSSSPPTPAPSPSPVASPPVTSPTTSPARSRSPA